MSFIHLIRIGHLSPWTHGSTLNVVRPLTLDDVRAIEQEVAEQFNQLVELEGCLTAEGYLYLRCWHWRDFDEAYQVAWAARCRLGTVAGESETFGENSLRRAVWSIKVREREIARIQAIPRSSARVAAVIEHLKNPGIESLRAPHTFRAVMPAEADALPLLRRTLYDERWTVRHFAAEALARMKARAAPALDDLIARFEDADRHVRSAAIRAIGSMGIDGASAIEALSSLADTDGHIACVIVDAFARMGRIGITALSKLLDHHEWYTRYIAAARLAKSPELDSTVLAALAERAADPNEHVKVRLEARRTVRRNAAPESEPV